MSILPDRYLHPCDLLKKRLLLFPIKKDPFFFKLTPVTRRTSGDGGGGDEEGNLEDLEMGDERADSVPVLG